jgi:hypothetical protein
MSDFEGLKEYIGDLKLMSESDRDMYYKNEGDLYKDPETLVAICNAKANICDQILRKMDRMRLDTSIKS